MSEYLLMDFDDILLILSYDLDYLKSFYNLIINRFLFYEIYIIPR